MPTSVALSPHFETFIRQQVEAGRFNNASEVVRAGLRLLEEREAEQAAKLQALREAIAVGLASGPCLSEAEVFDRLEAKFLALAEAAERV
ncbi:predicted transcriptional regulators containing the CopG/Arc/MetJ DNA-binding domain [Serpentinimonas maccroryi]|uniref:Predicted transcriptional regulators containing the CopG/Arc/MetJ DNA-binding domain n=1 Tax=Serpentinimonas maccroryi TaxID=1458426 RepID=A0A060NK01_9BURK|nr:type II toxin-antitoxin system ParD family antitoxin [Serpentinimonas maccroryi]BAO82721.1 predicted transcriptional regulators containing the CopG/Arc/MetJ DNA-binding domain [Serpentinimonas maccroryi]